MNTAVCGLSLRGRVLLWWGTTGLLLVVATDSCANAQTENIKNFE